MDISRNTSSEHHSEHEHDDVRDADRDAPVEALHLARAVGRRLGARLQGQRRDDLLEDLVRAASDANVTGASDRVVTDGQHLHVPSGRGDASRSDSRPGSRRGRVRSRRLVAMLASVGVLAALGGASTVLLRGGDDLPIVLLASGAPGAPGVGSDAASSPLRSSAELGADVMWWTPTIHRFVLADGVTYPAGSATAWRLVPPADLAAGAARLAATLGLPAPVPSEWDPNALQSATEDGAGLWVGPSGDWYFHGPFDSSLAWDCPAVPGDGGPDSPVSTMPYSDAPCTAPEPPSGVPSEARARELAREVLARVGHSQVRITDVYADEWGAWVSAEPVVDGLPQGSGLAVSVGFGGAERVTSANGTLAAVERVGDYPTIDAVAALARLEAELSAWLTEGGPVARPLPAEDGPVTILPVPEPAPEPAPGTSEPEPEPVEVTVTIVKVELVTSLAWTAEGGVLLMPHYRLTDSDGGWWSVVAVSDRYVTR